MNFLEKGFRKLIYLAIFALLSSGLSLAGGTGCETTPAPPPPPTPTPTPSSTPTPTAVADLAITDDGDPDDEVFIYYDIFNTGTAPTIKFGVLGDNPPDVILDEAGSMLEDPQPVFIANNMLFVGNLAFDTGLTKVTIFNDFLGLTNGQAPSVTLDEAMSGIDDPQDLFVFNNDLYVANRNNNTVGIFQDVATLANNDPPDVTLNMAMSGIDEPLGLTVTSSALYVANNDDAMGVVDDTVTIYNDPSTLIDNNSPDVTLDNAMSLIADPRRVFVIDNVLYVVQNDPGEGAVLAFSPADGLIDMQAPDFILFGPSGVDDPRALSIVANRLFVPGSDEDSAGLLGFDDPANLMDFDPPSVFVDMFPIQDCDDLSSVAGTLFVLCDDFPGAYGYLDPGNMVSNQSPDTFFTDSSMGSPNRLSIVERP